MKLPIYILSILFCFTSFAQKKKEIRKYKIRCINEIETVGTKTLNAGKEIYNANGDVVTEFNYGKDGTLKSTIQYKYVNGKDLSEEIKYDSLNHIAEKKKYKYNGLGEKTEEMVKDKDDKIIKKMKYVYNANGLKSERRTYDAADKLISVKKYYYNCK